MEISSYGRSVVSFGTAPTVAEGEKLCSSIPACVGINVLVNGSAVTRGTGNAGENARRSTRVYIYIYIPERTL